MSPRSRFWLVTLAAISVVAVTASLGFWQLSRGAQKQSLKNRIVARAALPALGASDLFAAGLDLDALLHRPVVLRGHWLEQASVFLDNRPMAGRSGFILVTPLQPLGFGQAVLVQRGWVPRDFQDRSKVPTVPTAAGEVEVQGRLALPPSRLFELGTAESGRIRQNLELDAVSQASGLPLPALSVLQTGISPEGLQRQWPRFESAVHKHHGYAAQWFAMAVVTAGLYVWFQLISPRRRHKLHGQNSR